MDQPMRLYVWRSRTELLAVAMAHTLDEAKKMLIAAGQPEFHFVGYALQGENELVSPVAYERPAGVPVINW